ncbi:VOC family protein [Alteribacter natronophilus]|uniref:VOC family protein n=1 Tax=Alteribacter natronophilus TaxID=2583810 RepID=UPI00110F3755|nr:VOC family protein [Alteribacter natronophilus]TMW71455.1 VOC family protein [Alteribacter natronophilus]
MKQQAVPYFIFDGQAAEALAFYEQVFDGEVTERQTFGEADFPTPPEAEDRILHARFRKGPLYFMVSDAFPGSPVTTGNHVALVLEMETEEEIHHYYDRLRGGGEVLMELQDTFWGATYAKVKDRFGRIWDLNLEKQQSAPE